MNRRNSQSCLRTSAIAVLASAVLPALPTAHGGVLISEFMAKNESTLVTADGQYADWIEIHNDSAAAVDLAGWYLTDDPADLRKWQFPSTAATSPLAGGGYLLVFASGSADAVIGGEIHAGFKLGAEGEYLALVEPDGETIAAHYHPAFPAQHADVSYGIDPGTGIPAYFAAPTPGAANAAAIAGAVRFSIGSRAFDVPFTLELSTSSPAASIRYTLDGSVPTAASTPYLSPLPISTTSRVRARAFAPGLLDGPVASETYYRLDAGPAGFSSNLPVVVIDNFGAGEIPDPDSPTRQPCGLMILDPVDGACRLLDSPAIATRAGLRRRGESSLRNTATKPSLSIETWGEADEETRSIEPFGMPAESDWILYAPWTIDTAMIRNPFIYEVSNQAGRYAVRTRFVEVFLNSGGGSISDSDYYGVHVFMERIKQGPDRVDVADLPSGAASEPDVSGGYIWKLDKLDPDDQTFTAAGKTLAGVYPAAMPTAQLDWLVGCVNEVDAAITNKAYASVIDVESFADHHILNVFANNADGLRVSTFYHKDRNGLVQMGPIWDFDRSMGCDNDARASNPEVWSLATDPLYFFHNSGPLWFRSLALNDPDFWIVWEDRWQAMRNGPLSDAAIAERIERYRAELAAAALRNYARWPSVLGASAWSGKVDVMKAHVLTRAQWIDEQFIDPPVLSHGGGLVGPGFQLGISGPQTKYFTLDGRDPRAKGGSAAGTAYAAPITITGNTLVRARAGSGASFVNAPSTWPWSPITEAMFVVEPAPLAITEIMYHPRPPAGPAEAGFSASDFEFIEIRNTGSAPCNLVGVQLLDGVRFDFTHGASATLGAGAHGIVVGDLAAFKARYADWAAMNILGVFDGSLSDGTEKLLLGYDTADAIALAEFDYEDDWYPCTDGEGFSLVLRDPQSNPSSWDAKGAWRHSAAVDGSPGSADPELAYPPGSIVINEVLSQQDGGNPDGWIELHNTTGSSIGIGGWFLSDSRGNLEKYVIPAGTVVPAGGYVVFTGHDHFGSAFGLSRHGDSVFVSAGSGGVLSEPAYRESESFSGQDPGVSFGRHIRADGSVAFPAQAAATMGAANAGPRVGPLVIEEIMYHPPAGGHEYIVIRNTSMETVSLHDPAHPSNVWELAGIGFEFPAGVMLGPSQTLLLVRDTITPSLFRAQNQVPAAVEIFSYAGPMDDDSDTLVLRKPGNPEAGTGYVPNIVIDEVKYNDDPPWPPAADGLGKALGRIDPGAYANDPANWQAVDAGYGPVMFTLAVAAGAGDGAYTEGTVVAIQADAAAPNQAFVRWIGNVAAVADVSNPSTTLTMPAGDLTITALYSTETTFIAADAGWKFHDLGQNLGTAWRMPSYDDSQWPAGAAQLGYGDNDEATGVGFGGDPSNKYITTYFRREFTVNAGPGLGNLSLDLLRDDGAVVYLNGQEAVRDNMPAGTVGHLTPASSTVGGTAEDAFQHHALSPASLVDGVNVIAVEVHQRTADSSDLSFALRLEGFQTVNEAVLDGDADGMHDAWEVTHFGSTEAALPEVDSDGDGLSNSGEFIAGSLPGDPSSCFRIERIDGREISWTAVPGRTYTVYWTADLRTAFVPIAGGLVGGSYTDTLHPTDKAGFYRVKAELK